MEGIEEIVDDLRGVEHVCRMDEVDRVQEGLEVIAVKAAQ